MLGEYIGLCHIHILKLFSISFELRKSIFLNVHSPRLHDSPSISNRLKTSYSKSSRKYERKSGSIEAAGDRDVLKSPSE